MIIANNMESLMHVGVEKGDLLYYLDLSKNQPFPLHYIAVRD